MHVDECTYHGKIIDRDVNGIPKYPSQEKTIWKDYDTPDLSKRRKNDDSKSRLEKILKRKRSG
jgi:hypothetical protein